MGWTYFCKCFQYRLKSLLLLIVVVAVALALWKQVRVAEQQKRSVAAIEELGGVVKFDYQVEKRPESSNGPTWLRNLIGRHYFDRVVQVELRGDVYGGPRAPSDLSLLSGLDDLKVLYLDYTMVSDLSALSGKRSLEFLSLNYSPVQDLSPLASLYHLEALSVAGTHVSDITPLAGLTNLKRVWLDGTRVKNITPLQGKDLECLSLSGTPVDDISALSGAANLTKLNLSHTRVTDITPLSKLTGLKDVDLHWLDIDDEPVDTLKKDLPNCYLVYP